MPGSILLSFEKHLAAVEFKPMNGDRDGESCMTMMEAVTEGRRTSSHIPTREEGILAS